MSSRISSLASNNQLINILLNTQRRLQDTQIQLSTGKVSPNYDGITLGSERVVNLENTQGALEKFIINNDSTALQLDVMETALEAVRQTVRDFKSFLGDLSASGTATLGQVKDIQDTSIRSLANMEEYLNTKVNGQYIFAGGRNNTRPVNLGITTLAAFQSIYDGVTVNYPTTRDAHLADFSISKDTNNESGLFVNASNFMTFRQDDGTQTSTINLGGGIEAADVIQATINGTNVTFTTTTTSATDAATGLAAAINANTTINSSVNATSTGGTVTITSETGATPFTLGASSWTTDGSGANNTVTDATFAVTASGVSTIESTSAQFANVKAGTTITITGTQSNNGTYTVKSVSADKTKIEVVTEMLTTETATAAQFELSDKVGATTQKNTITALHGGTTTVDDTYTATINGVNVVTTLTADETSNDLLAKAIADNINSSTNAAVTPINAVAATDGSGNVVLTAKVPGVAFTLATSSVNATDGKITSVNNILNGTGTSGTVLTNATTGTVTFSRSGDTITAANDGVFSGVKVGEVITVTGTKENDGTYTVTKRDDNSKILTVKASKLTDEGVDTGSTFFDYAAGTQVVFNNAASTIQVKTNGGAAALSIFSGTPGLAVGDSITVKGAATAGNNTTYSVTAISSDGSTLTVSPAPNTTETIDTTNDTAAVKITGTGFSYTAVTQLVITNVGAAGTDTIQVQDAFAAAVPNVFANLRAGMKITLGGVTSNNGTFTIKSISSDKSTITVEEDITTTETTLATDAPTMKVFAADGTITASPYYSGDKVARTQRIDKDREFNIDLNAVDPAFEKAIRAMSIIAQGIFATEGGLDQNKGRIQDSLFLLSSSVSPTVSATPPFGTELSSNIEQIQSDLAFDRVLLSETNDAHARFIGFLQSSIAKTEDADPLDTITRLLDDSRTLEASYEALARIRDLSLVNFLR